MKVQLLLNLLFILALLLYGGAALGFIRHYLGRRNRFDF